MSTDMANGAINDAYSMASTHPDQAGVYAQVAIAQALLAVAEELKAYTAMIERKDD